MHILVVGGAGYIGSHTAKALAGAGHVPIVYDSLEKGHREAVRWGPLIHADLADRQRLRETLALYPIEGVIHFAAYIAVGESMQQPGRYFSNNVANTIGLLDAMVEADVRRIVFSSTAAVYGDPERVPIPEEHPLRPVSVYGESKLMVERILEWYDATQGVSSVRLRYFNAAGADPEGELGEDHHPETHLIPLCLRAAGGEGPPLELYGTDYPTPDGTAIRDYIHVTDLAAAHVLALEHLARGGSSLTANLGAGSGHSVRAVLQSVERASGLSVPLVEKPRRAGDAIALVADSTRARSRLAWSPVHSDLDEIVATAWAWYRKKPGARS